jgi:hypothetical protein
MGKTTSITTKPVYTPQVNKGSVETQKKNNNIFNVTVNTGAGFAAKVGIGVVKAEVGVKMYNSVSTSGTPTKNLQGGVQVNVTSKAKVALEGSRTIESNGKTSGSGFAGLAVGDQKYGVGNAGTKGDVKLQFGVGAWVFAGGEVNVDVNLSAAARKINSEVIAPATQKLNNAINKLTDPRTWGIRF